MQRRVASIAFLLGSFTVLGGCELIASVDRSLLDDATGGGGNPTTGGGGSGATGGGGTGGTGGGTGATGGTGGTGGGPECEMADMCPAAPVCQDPACNGGMCEVTNEPADTACTDGALTGICDGDGACVECLDDDDCSGADTCDLGTNACVAPGCSDGMLNGDETDVDCGGSCNKCMNTDTCAVDLDCVSGFCNATVCAACTGPADCATSEFCNAGVCEADDVNGSVCAAVTGDATGDSQCASGQCETIGNNTKMCCDVACEGACRVCATSDGAATNGVCQNAANGMDPKMACASSDCATGTCDAGSCGFEPPTTDCGVGPTCAAGMQKAQDQCAGNADTCVMGMTMSCGLYDCGATACLTTCAAQADCIATAYCILGTAVGTMNTCADKKAMGACNEDFECEDDTCVANLCE